MNLYELTEQYRQLQELEGESMALAIADTMEAIEGQFEDKAIALIKVTKNMASDVAVLDDEIKRLQNRKRAMENRQEALRDYLRENMEASGITKISCPLFTINCTPGRPIAVIEDEASLPAEYVSEKIVRAPDKKAITEALKEGASIPGARLGHAKASIRIG